MILIIFLATTKVGESDQVVAFVSFGLTLSAFILSLLSIFHNIASGFSLNDTRSSIEAASDAINKSSHSINTTAETLFERMDTLPGQVRNVVTSQTEELLRGIQAQQNPPPIDVKQIDDVKLARTQEHVQYYLEYAALYALIVVWVLARSCELGRVVSDRTIREILDHAGGSLLTTGLMHGLTNLGFLVIETELSADGAFLYKVKSTFFHSASVKEAITKQYDKSSDGLKNVYKPWIENMEKAFA